MNAVRTIAFASLAALALAGCEDRAAPVPAVAVAAAQPPAVPSVPSVPEPAARPGPPPSPKTGGEKSPPPQEASPRAISREEAEFNRPAPK